MSAGSTRAGNQQPERIHQYVSFAAAASLVRVEPSGRRSLNRPTAGRSFTLPQNTSVRSSEDYEPNLLDEDL
jgi:hypothetical protein